MPQTGTLTADGTEQTIFTTSDAPGVVYWYLDLSNLQDGDSVTVREKVDINGNGTYNTHEETTYTDSQSIPIISQSSDLLTLGSVPVRLTLEQTAGTNRDYKYAEGVDF